MENDNIVPIPLSGENVDSMIKIVGVGGGGGNAVNYMYQQGIANVSYLVCNTDQQALGKMMVPAKLQLGPGNGAGGKPEVARGYAEENREKIREALDDGTKMLFIAAGMGGGTGTGASPIVAEVAQEMGILTVGIVTIPFIFERGKKIRKAMEGLAALNKCVDALLVIHNEKLKDIYPELTLFNAFDKANEVVANAARSIADIITIPGVVNTDFADVYNTLHEGGVAIMNVGRAGGENRITNAINNALESPLVNTKDVHGAKRLLIQFYCSPEHPIQIYEVDQINKFVDLVGEEVEVQWGAAIINGLDEDVSVTIIATGYDIDEMPTLDGEKKEGGKSIDDAVREFYADNQPAKEEPAQNSDEQPHVINFGESDLNSSAGASKDVPEANEIKIRFDDDTTSSPGGSQVAAAASRWLRRNRG